MKDTNMRTPLMIGIDAELAWDRAAQAAALGQYYGRMEYPCQEMHMESEENDATLSKAELEMKSLDAELAALNLTPEGRDELMRYVKWFTYDDASYWDRLWLIPDVFVATCYWPHAREVEDTREDYNPFD